nr:hypothetical protein [Palleronia aestuarii]
MPVVDRAATVEMYSIINLRIETGMDKHKVSDPGVGRRGANHVREPVRQSVVQQTEAIAPWPPAPFALDFVHQGRPAIADPECGIDTVKNVEQHQLVIAGKQDEAIGSGQGIGIKREPDSPETVGTAINQIPEKDDDPLCSWFTLCFSDLIKASGQEIRPAVDISDGEHFGSVRNASRHDPGRQADMHRGDREGYIHVTVLDEGGQVERLQWLSAFRHGSIGYPPFPPLRLRLRAMLGSLAGKRWEWRGQPICPAKGLHMLNVPPGTPASVDEFWHEIEGIHATLTTAGATGACQIVPPRGWVRATRAAADAIADRLARNRGTEASILDFKEKFGGARLYVCAPGIELNDITAALTEVTGRTCMLTGANVEKRCHTGWLAPLSDEAIREMQKGGRTDFDLLLYPARSVYVS